MKRNMWKVTAAACAMTGMLAGMAVQAEEAEPLQMWTWRGTEELMKMDTKDIMAVQEISNRTGVAAEWLNPSDATTEFQMIMTSGEDMPDAMFYKYTPQDVMQYAANGNIIDSPVILRRRCRI